MSLRATLRWLIFRHYAKPIAAIVLVALLPGVAAASILTALLAQIPGADMVEQLATRNVSYWFISLAVVAITSWSFIVKWLLKQLELQRAANQDTTTKLIGYMERDHSAMVKALSDVSAVQERTVLALERVIARLDAVEKRRE